MPFDPTKPVENTPLDAAEMRAQFNALAEMENDLSNRIDALPQNDGMIDWLTDNSARNVDAILPLTLNLSDPPTKAQVQAMLTKLNDLIGGLHH